MKGHCIVDNSFFSIESFLDWTEIIILDWFSPNNAVSHLSVGVVVPLNPKFPYMQDSAIAIARPPLDKSCADSIRFLLIADRRVFWTNSSWSKSICGFPIIFWWINSIKSDPARESIGESIVSAPRSMTTSFSFLNPIEIASSDLLRIPIAPIIGVGNIALLPDWLYKLTLPLITGTLNFLLASAIPLIDSDNWY